MVEIRQIQAECPVMLQEDNLAECVHEPWLAIRSQAHDLVLVAIMAKPQMLGQALIEDAQRMGKKDAVRDGQACAAAHAPGGGGEIARTVDRHRQRFAIG